MIMRFLVACLFTVLFNSSAFAAVINVTVDGKTMPWLSNATLNSSFAYGIGDGLGPVVVDSSSGINFVPGGSLIITRVSGLTSAFTGPPTVDGLGYTILGAANDNPGSSGQLFPSAFAPADWDTLLMALMGTFADSTGAIVGTPFEVGNARSIVIPVGATRLQLGLNDDIFADNTGALNLTISGPNPVVVPPTVPVPGTLVLLGLGLPMLLNRRRRR